MNPWVDELRALLDEPLNDAAPTAFDPRILSLPMEPMLESARRFGTPQYFLEADQLRSIAAHFVQTMQTSVPRSHAFYALKSNDLPALGQIVHQQGLQADVAGLFELQLALELGFGTILFSSPGKTREELELALQHPNRVILIVDNLSELKRIIDLARAMAPPHGPCGSVFACVQHRRRILPGPSSAFRSNNCATPSTKHKPAPI